MRRRIDGRTTKGRRIRQQVRERILAANIALIRGGVPSPTTREVADRAGLSSRVIFKHFPDLRTLRLESFRRMQAQSSKFFSGKAQQSGSAAVRLEHFLKLQARRLEFVTPLHRTAAMVASIDPDVARAVRAARNAARRDLEKTLGSSLNRTPPRQRRDLLTALHLVCSWESWEILRHHHRMSCVGARTFMTRIALAVLTDATRKTSARHRRSR